MKKMTKTIIICALFIPIASFPFESLWSPAAKGVIKEEAHRYDESYLATLPPELHEEIRKFIAAQEAQEYRQAMLLKEALEDNDVAKFDALFASGINPNLKMRYRDIRDIDREITPIHLIFYIGPKDLVGMLKTLVKYHADINAKDEHGQTALFLALYTDPNTVEFLLNHGADPNVIDNDGKTISDDVATQFGFIQRSDLAGIAKLLRDHGAKRAAALTLKK